MNFYVAVTDNNWFRFLAERKPDEANFWLPSSGTAFRALDPGGLLLFKLHSPEDYVAGGGFFVKYFAMPVSLAWRAFGEKNGVGSEGELRRAIGRYRDRGGSSGLDPTIGCVVLASPFFFARDAPGGRAPPVAQRACVCGVRRSLRSLRLPRDDTPTSLRGAERRSNPH